IRREVPDIAAASAVYQRWGIRLTVEGSRVNEEALVQGVDASFARMKDMAAGPGGRFLNERDIDERRRVVFLADSLARVLFPAGDALGNSVRLRNQPSTIIGIAPRRVQTSNESNDDNLAVIPSTAFAAIYNQRNPSRIVIRAVDPQNSEEAQAHVKRLLAERHRFDRADRSAVVMQDWAADARMASRILTGIQVFMGMVGGLTLLVAAVGVAN